MLAWISLQVALSYTWFFLVIPWVQDATEPASTMQVVINGTRCLFIRWNGLKLPAWDENAFNSTELRALGKSTFLVRLLLKLSKPTEFKASEHRISEKVLWRVGTGASQRHVTSADFIHQVTLWFQRSGTTSQPLDRTKNARTVWFPYVSVIFWVATQIPVNLVTWTRIYHDVSFWRKCLLAGFLHSNISMWTKQLLLMYSDLFDIFFLV